jgi:hypothetical protein
MVSAGEHRMTGLLAQSLEQDRLRLTRERRVQLAAYNLRVRSHHHGLWNALTGVTQRLAEIGVDLANFKGVTAEARWYDNLGERPCTDVDLLLSPHQLDRIDEVIALIQPDHPLAGRAQAMADLNQLQHVDLRWTQGIALDLHFDLLKVLIPGRHAGEIWRRTSLFAAPGLGTVRVVDPETSLVQSLLHLTKDRFPFLLGFVDVVRIVERENLDWDYIDRFLREEGLETSAYLALAAVFDTLQLPQPSVPVVRGWRKSVWRILWGPQTQLQGAVGRATHHRRQFWIPILARGRSTEGLRRLWQLAFPPKALMDHYHPHTRGPYLWRLLWGRLRRSLERRQRAVDAR